MTIKALSKNNINLNIGDLCFYNKGVVQIMDIYDNGVVCIYRGVHTNLLNVKGLELFKLTKEILNLMFILAKYNYPNIKIEEITVDVLKDQDIKKIPANFLAKALSKSFNTKLSTIKLN